jgi:hypothetical protein
MEKTTGEDHERKYDTNMIFFQRPPGLEPLATSRRTHGLELKRSPSYPLIIIHGCLQVGASSVARSMGPLSHWGSAYWGRPAIRVCIMW